MVVGSYQTLGPAVGWWLDSILSSCLFKPLRISSKFNILVRSSLFFQHHKHTFIIIYCNLIGSPLYMRSFVYLMYILIQGMTVHIFANILSFRRSSFTSLIMNFNEQSVLMLKPNTSMFSFVHVFDIISKNLLPNLKSWRFAPVFF